MDMQTPQPKPTPHWRIIVAFVLDFFSAFLILGTFISSATGSTTDRGFTLSGWPALIFILGLIGYFLIFNRFFGGTVWKHILGVKPR
ncbi:hypothetical protein P7L87_24360 [Vibrio parahaemolyticus]|nr:hypothetical protein [Vibrio parahaemolyticus]